MKSYMAKNEENPGKWHLIDAEGKILGRLSTEIAILLRGKNKPTFTPQSDTGDFVVVVNAEKVKLTGKKAETKKYYRHTAWFGGIKCESYKGMLEKTPHRIVEEAVWGMLPKNAMGKKLLGKLKVYAGPEHPHKAQKVEAYKLRYRAE